MVKSACTPLGRTPVAGSDDVFVEVAKRVSDLVKRGLLRGRDERLFNVLGCPPGVDPMHWIECPKGKRRAAWTRWKVAFDTWHMQCSPSILTWTGGTRMVPRGLFGGEGAAQLAGLEEGWVEAVPRVVGERGGAEEEMLVRLFLEEALP